MNKFEQRRKEKYQAALDHIEDINNKYTKALKSLELISQGRGAGGGETFEALKAQAAGAITGLAVMRHRPRPIVVEDVRQRMAVVERIFKGE